MRYVVLAMLDMPALDIGMCIVHQACTLPVQLSCPSLSLALTVGMGRDWAQKTNIFSPMDYKYRCYAICDDHNRFSYKVILGVIHKLRNTFWGSR